jgi:hypothetical protein
MYKNIHLWIEKWEKSGKSWACILARQPLLVTEVTAPKPCDIVFQISSLLPWLLFWTFFF